METSKFQFICPACRHKNELEVEEPTRFKPTNVKLTCGLCETRFLNNFSVKPKSNPPKWIVKTTPLWISEKAVEIINEREAGKRV